MGTIPRYSDPVSFLHFVLWKRALANSLVHILPTSSSKSAPNVAFCLHFEVPTELSRQSCNPLMGFPNGAPQLRPRKQRPYYGDHRSLFTRKNAWFRARKPFTHKLTHSRTVSLPTYLMMGGWHDDVVDMMVGMQTTTIVCNSEAFQLNFLW